MISSDNVIHTVIWVIVVGLIFYLLWWLLDYVKPPEPFYKVGKILLAVAAVLVLINILLGLTGHPLIK